jgi:hypothetical protein
MEMEQLLNMNGLLPAGEPAPAHAVNSVAPVQEMAQKAYQLDALKAKREQLIQSLNGARQQLETAAQSVARTEGALIMVNSMILELDPDAFKQQEQGG